MLYLLDANVLIDAARDYYSFEMVPEFWEWLQHHGTTGNVKVPLEIFEEITGGSDELAAWLQTDAARDALLLVDEAEPEVVNRVVQEGYAVDLTDREIIELGRDPFLISYAVPSPAERCVVSTEAPKPSARRQNRKVPDVCSTFGVSCYNTFELLRQLNFRTQWRA
jgi:hypothetical protein